MQKVYRVNFTKPVRQINLSTINGNGVVDFYWIEIVTGGTIVDAINAALLHAQQTGWTVTINDINAAMFEKLIH